MFKMKEKWRLLLTNENTAAINMAIDKAILFAHSKKLVPPTVRFYSWNPSAISIGYFQSLKDEVDLEACKKYSVDYVRRITGGGAVFHENELTYSIIIDENHPEVSDNILESYKRICGAIMYGLENFGVTCAYRPINDIVYNNKKISGNAQTRQNNTLLQHGTVLLDVDVEKMFTILKVPNEKMKDKLIKNVKQSVTSLKNIVGRKVIFDELIEDMIKGFEDEFNIELVKGSLIEEEINYSNKFEKEYFSSKKWNNKR